MELPQQEAGTADHSVWVAFRDTRRGLPGRVRKLQLSVRLGSRGSALHEAVASRVLLHRLHFDLVLPAVVACALREQPDAGECCQSEPGGEVLSDAAVLDADFFGALGNQLIAVRPLQLPQQFEMTLAMLRLRAAVCSESTADGQVVPQPMLVALRQIRKEYQELVAERREASVAAVC
eukprot:m51a1_g9977 hypothetical protein (178) ;mRNA; f:117620-118388